MKMQKIFSLIVIVMLCVLTIPPSQVLAAGILYVKESTSGSGDCSTWDNACLLQTALTNADIGEEIWVATGTYRPTDGSDRNATFQLKEGVALYGGFLGTELVRTDRNPKANITILSGEIGSEDILDNSNHVVSGANDTILDGFTITAGYTIEGGAGMYNNASSPILKNIIFSDNTASLGGGIYNVNYSSPRLTDVTFYANIATSLGGGGIYNDSSSSTLTNVTFDQNIGQGGGGGIYNSYSSATLTNVTFFGNSAGDWGAGGGIKSENSSTTLTNVTFSGNTAYSGGGIFTFASGTPTINAIFWGNTATDGPQILSSGGLSISDSVVQDGYASGTHIIIDDPKLGVLGDYGGFTGTLPIQTDSSAIDTGDDTYCPQTDQRGVSRPQGAHCDIGAYEYADITPPTVSSITRVFLNPTVRASVDFMVTFSEPVSNVSESDFTLSTSDIIGASITNLSGGPTIYTITVNTGSGSGLLHLNLVDHDTIVDLASNLLGGPGTGNGDFTSGETYDIRPFQIFIPLTLK